MRAMACMFGGHVALATPFEGAALIAVYIVLAVIAAFEP